MSMRLSASLWRSFTRRNDFCTLLCSRQLSYKASADLDREEMMEKFNENGYIVLRKVITGQLIHEMQRHVDWLLEKYPDIPPEHLHHLIMRRDPFWMRLVSDSRLVDIASTFVGPDIALFASHYFCKLPRMGKKVLWHQDGSYWPLQPMNVVSLWLSVDNATIANGCLRVVRGSYKSSLKELQSDTDGDTVLGSMTHTDVNEEHVVNIELEPAKHHQVNCYRSWPRFMPGYHMTFEGSDRWNDSRYVNPDDEPYFDSLTEQALEQDVRREVMEVIEGLHTDTTS